MSGLDINERETREELANQGNNFVGNVFAMCASNKERWLLEPHLVRILEWEIPQVVQRLRQYAERDAKFPRLAALGLVEIAKEELANGKVLRVFLALQFGVCKGRRLGCGKLTGSYSWRILSASL